MKPSDLVDKLHEMIDDMNVLDIADTYEHITGRGCYVAEDGELQVRCDQCDGSGQVMSEGFINLGQGDIKRTEHWNECPECNGKGWK